MAIFRESKKPTTYETSCNDFTTYTNDLLNKNSHAIAIPNNKWFELHQKIVYMNTLYTHLKTINYVNDKGYETFINSFLTDLNTYKNELTQQTTNVLPEKIENDINKLLMYKTNMFGRGYELLTNFKNLNLVESELTDTETNVNSNNNPTRFQQIYDIAKKVVVVGGVALALASPAGAVIDSIAKDKKDSDTQVNKVFDYITMIQEYDHMLNLLKRFENIDLSKYSPLPIVASAAIPNETQLNLNLTNSTNATETQIIPANNTSESNTTIQPENTLLANTTDTSINEAPPSPPTTIAGSIQLDGANIENQNNYTLNLNVSNTQDYIGDIVFDGEGNSFFSGLIPSDGTHTIGDLIEFYLHDLITGETFKSNNTSQFIPSADIYPVNASFTDTIPPILTSNYTLTRSEGEIEFDDVNFTFNTNELASILIEKGGIPLVNDTNLETSRNIKLFEQSRGNNTYNITVSDEHGNTNTTQVNAPIVYLTGNISGTVKK